MTTIDCKSAAQRGSSMPTEENRFKLVSPYQPTGDQPPAIEKLVEGVQRGDQ